MLDELVGLAGTFLDDARVSRSSKSFESAGDATLTCDGPTNHSLGLRATSTVFLGRCFSFCRLTVTDFLRVGLGRKVWNIAAGRGRGARAPSPGRCYSLGSNGGASGAVSSTCWGFGAARAAPGYSMLWAASQALAPVFRGGQLALLREPCNASFRHRWLPRARWTRFAACALLNGSNNVSCSLVSKTGGSRA